MQVGAPTAWSAITSQFAEKLSRDKYVVFDELPISEYVKESFQNLADTFQRLSEYQGGDDFIQRHFDIGEFKVSLDRVEPHKGRSLDNSYSVSKFKNEELYQNACLHRLLRFTLKSLPGTTSETIKYISVMLTRHSDSVPALDPHHDGMVGYGRLDDPQWIAQYAIHRSQTGITGGEIVLTSGDEILEQRLLDKPLGGYIVNDRERCHGATAITITEPGAVRDVLILRIKKGPQNW